LRQDALTNGFVGRVNQSTYVRDVHLVFHVKGTIKSGTLSPNEHWTEGKAAGNAESSATLLGGLAGNALSSAFSGFALGY